MFMVPDRKTPDRRVPDRKAQWHSTLERRYDFHLGEAIRAGLQGSRDKAAEHARQALLISRELYADTEGAERHQSELAAALWAHARYGGGAPRQAVALLTESADHYAALAQFDPATYEVPRINVLTRIALVSDAAGGTRDAIGLLHEAIDLYLKAPAADHEERDIAIAKARFHLGACLLKVGMDTDGLAELGAGLELAADVLDRLRLDFSTYGWLVGAPRYLQLSAPDWAAAAVRSMTLHARAGCWPRAVTAARVAIGVSGGLAQLGGDTVGVAHQKISARAEEILAGAMRPERSAVDHGH
ncbi:MAG: hypothetical protein ACRDNS_08880 [Trebonia sp.]